MRKVGHAGTLDPMATGLLVVAVGRVTRLIRFVQTTVKEYVATMVLGVATDTLDADGAVLSREPLPVTRAEVGSATRRFVGDIHQIPPMVSAVKIGGRRLYEMARAGETIERLPRPVRIDEIEIIEFAPGQYSGGYVSGDLLDGHLRADPRRRHCRRRWVAERTSVPCDAPPWGHCRSRTPTTFSPWRPRRRGLGCRA